MHLCVYIFYTSFTVYQHNLFLFRFMIFFFFFVFCIVKWMFLASFIFPMLRKRKHHCYFLLLLITMLWLFTTCLYGNSIDLASSVSSVQFSSFSQLFPTLCNPMNCSMPGFPVHHQLPQLAQTHVHRVNDGSNHLILCCPLLLLPLIFPSIRVLSNESVLHIR